MNNDLTRDLDIPKAQAENINFIGFPYTKFLMPNANNKILERNRLFERLKVINEKKLTSICAPAGFGKTTLICSWIRYMDFEKYTAWVSLDDGDDSLFIFWQAIVTSISTLIPKQFDQCLYMFKAYKPYPMDSIINLLINKLGSLSDSIFIILDDFHTINNSEIHKYLQYFLKRLPSNVHILLTSRHKPSKSISTMKMKTELLDLYCSDLRFTIEETNQFIEYTLNLNISREGMQELYNTTDGWITAIKLYANSLSEKHQLLTNPSLSSSCNKYLMDYLTEETINMQPENIQNFLIKSSILDTLNISLCDYVLEIKNSHEILELLEENNIFIYALDNESRNFRYFDLFRKFMKSKLSSLSKEYLNNLYIRASEWYENHGLYTFAIDYSLKTNNFKNSVRLLEYCSIKYAQKAESFRLINYIEKIPSKYINSPTLVFAYAIALASIGKLDKDELYLRNRGISLDRKEYENFKGEIAAIRAFNSTNVGYLPGLLDQSLYALSLLDEFTGLTAMAHATAAYAYLLKLEIKDASLHIEQAIEIAVGLNHMFALIMSVHLKADLLMMELKLGDALSLYENILKLLGDEGEITIQVSNYLYLGLGTIYYESNNIELAQKYINRSIELSELRRDNSCLIHCYLVLTKICASLNDKSALSYIEKIDELCDTQQSKFTLLQKLQDLVKVLIRLDRLDLAEYAYNKYTINADYELKYFRQLPLLDILIAKKRYNEALAIIKEADNQRTNQTDTIFSFYTFIHKALIYAGLEQKENALLYLSKALLATKDEGWIRTFVDYGEPMFIIINELLETDKNQEIYENGLRETAIKLLLNFDNSFLYKTQSNIISDREHEILILVSQGLTNVEIAKKLYLAVITVKKHLSSIFVKLNASNRVQAVEAYRKILNKST